MDLSSDNSFVTFKHFPHLDICPTETIDKMKYESERKLSNWSSELLPTFRNLTELKDNLASIYQTTILKAKEKCSSLKADVFSKQNIVKELKVQVDITESELKDITEHSSETEVEELMKEVVILEKEKKQRQEKLFQHRDAIIKCLRYYKQCLDCHITFSPPNIFTFYFSKRKKNGLLSKHWIRFSTDDYKYWQFEDASLPSEEKDRISQKLTETNNTPQILCEVRRYIKKTERN